MLNSKPMIKAEVLDEEKWIRTKDRLPDYDVPVLVFNGWVHAAMLSYEEGWLWCAYQGYGSLCDNTCYECDDDYQYDYWMPLPEPPKE